MFGRLVDLLRASLKEYNFTPSELREAAILAATMHENQHIKPLFIKNKFDWMYLDEAKYIPYETITGRFSSTKPNLSNTPKENLHCHVFVGTGMGYSVCEKCGMVTYTTTQ